MLEKGVSDHRHERMAVKALLGSPLEMVEAEFLFQLKKQAENNVPGWRLDMNRALLLQLRRNASVAQSMGAEPLGLDHRHDAIGSRINDDDLFTNHDMPTSAINASSKSPVETPLRWRIGINTSRLLVRRA